MKNLILSSVFLLLTFISFSQIINLNVTKVDQSVYKRDTLKYTIERETNTTYLIDVDKKTMSITFTDGRENIKNKKVNIDKKSEVYFISYDDVDLSGFGRDMSVVIKIDPKKNKVEFKNQHYIMSEKDLTKVIINFKSFKLKIS